MAEVERIVDRKTIRGRVHYLVAWRGFGVENNTWESRVDLISDGYRQQINDFEKARKNGEVYDSPTSSSGSKSPKSPARGSKLERSRSRSRSVSRSRPATPKPKTSTRSRSRSASRAETPRKSSSAKKPAKSEASTSPHNASPRSSPAKSVRSPLKLSTAEEGVQGDRCPLSIRTREWFLRIIGALVVLFSVILGHFLPPNVLIPEQLLFLGPAAAFLAPLVSLLVFFFRRDDRDFTKWIAIFLVWRAAAEFLLYVSNARSKNHEFAIAIAIFIANLAFVIALVSALSGKKDCTSASAVIFAILGFLAVISSDAILLKNDSELISLRVLLMSIAVIAISFTPAL